MKIPARIKNAWEGPYLQIALITLALLVAMAFVPAVQEATKELAANLGR